MHRNTEVYSPDRTKGIMLKDAAEKWFHRGSLELGQSTGWRKFKGQRERGGSGLYGFLVQILTDRALS